MGISWRQEFHGEAGGCGMFLIDWGREKSGGAAGVGAVWPDSRVHRLGSAGVIGEGGVIGETGVRTVCDLKCLGVVVQRTVVTSSRDGSQISLEWISQRNPFFALLFSVPCC